MKEALTILAKQKSFWVAVVSVIAVVMSTLLGIEINQESMVALVIGIIGAVGGTHAVDNVRKEKHDGGK